MTSRSRKLRSDPGAVAAWRSALTRESVLLPADSAKAAISLRHRLHVARAAERRAMQEQFGPAYELDIDKLGAALIEQDGKHYVKIQQGIGALVVLDAATGQPVPPAPDPYKSALQEEWERKQRAERPDLAAFEASQNARKLVELGLPPSTPWTDALQRAWERKRSGEAAEPIDPTKPLFS